MIGQTLPIRHRPDVFVDDDAGLLVTPHGVLSFKSEPPLPPGELAGQSSGSATMVGALQDFLFSHGEASVTGSLTVVDAIYNLYGLADTLPYNLGISSDLITINDLEVAISAGGVTIVTASLTQTQFIAGASTGVATVTGTLYNSAPIIDLVGESSGVATVNGQIEQALGGGAGNVVELAGTSHGVATVTGYLYGTTAVGAHRHLYLYAVIGAGFDPTDEDPSADSQTFPDGHVRDFYRHLYHHVNVGVAFDPYDEDPTTDSQSFPDGHNRDDFARYQYFYLNLIDRVKGHGRLVARPGRPGKGGPLPFPDVPPSQRF